MSAAIDALLAGWRWWIGELAAFLPARLRAAFADPRDAIVIETGAEEIQVVRRSGAVETMLARIPRDPFAARTLRLSVPQPEGLARWLGEAVILELPADAGLTRALRLPRAARRNLDGIMRHEVMRQSPIGTENIYYDYRVTGSDADQIELELRIVQRADVDENLALCRNAGVAVAAVAFAGDVIACEGGTFPADAGAARRMRLRARLVPILLALVVFLGAAFVGSLYLRGDAIAADLDARIEAARQRAAAVEGLQRKLDAANRQAAFLARQKQNPAAVAVLATVARMLPDDTWLYEFELNGNEVRVHGFSAQAPALIARFDSSPFFTGAEFRAPLMQGPSAQLQRFDLSFKLRKGAS
jgi:general secretion pathway protein L